MKEDSAINKTFLLLRTWRLFRNNVGGAWQGKSKWINNKSDDIKKRVKKSIIIFMPKFIKYGLLKGSGDLIGWRTITITKEMVGTKIAQFVSVEVKTINDTTKREQKDWKDVVNNAGGLAVISREQEDGSMKIDGA